LVVYCQKGQRGYLAVRVLMGMGYEQVRNLRGGYLQARLNGLGGAGKGTENGGD
jgi:rhodanese-related sulfurtransferase